MEKPQSSTKRDILAEHLVEELQRGVTECGNDALSYVQSLKMRYSHAAVNREFLVSIAGAVEPEDRDLGADSDFPTAKAFHIGGLLALPVIEAGGGRDVFKRMLDVELRVADVTEIDDAGEQKHQLANSLLQLGEIGYAEVEQYHDFIDKYEDQLVPDVRYQRNIKRGFGFMMHAAQRAIEDLEREEMEQWLDTSAEKFDWDQAFRDL